MLIEAPAKINIVLKVGSVRKDNFHELFSLMQKISLFDRIEIEESDGIHIDGMDWLPKEENLMYRAAVLLKEKAGIQKGCNIKIEKNIPACGGLGGGSSDCAAVLKALNSLWTAELPLKELEEIGSALGSDVNFFLHDGPCIVRGRGEIVEELNTAANIEKDLLLVIPDIYVSTAEIYDNYRTKERLTEEDDTNKILDNYRAGNWEAILKNDLETTVYQMYTQLKELKNWLKEHELNSLLSGSGSCMFAISDNLDNINKVSALCWKKFGYKTLIVKTL